MQLMAGCAQPLHHPLHEESFNGTITSAPTVARAAAAEAAGCGSSWLASYATHSVCTQCKMAVAVY